MLVGFRGKLAHADSKNPGDSSFGGAYCSHGLAPAAAAVMLHSPPAYPSPGAALSVLYIALGASVLAYICWNRGGGGVGANAAGITVHLLPAFGTVLAILLLGESFAAFHAAGIATILAGVLLATRK